MTKDDERVISEALRLPPEARAALAGRLLESLDDDLKFVFITSQAKAVEVASEADETVAVHASLDAKCERCWHYRADTGSHADHPGLCARCVSNLFGAGERRRFA